MSKKVEALAVKAVTAIYRRAKMQAVPVYFASSPPVGAFMAIILAHTPRIDEKAVAKAQADAEVLAFGDPTQRMIDRYRDQMTHTKKYGQGAHKSQPGGGAQRKITMNVMRLGTQTTRLDSIFVSEMFLEVITPNRVQMIRVIMDASSITVRGRMHKLFGQRVNYHPWLVKEQADPAIGRASLAWNRYWLPGNHFVVWPNKRFALVSAEPKRLRTNERGQLHFERGEAVLYRDGWGVSAVNGIPVPAHLLKNPDLLTPDVILSINNAEVRRVLIEVKGYANWLREADAKLLHEDLDGELRPRRLYALPGTNRLNVLEVTNSTPEPDGSYKNYYLTVPAFMTTVEDALGWMLDDMTSGMMKQIEYRIES